MRENAITVHSQVMLLIQRKSQQQWAHSTITKVQTDFHNLGKLDDDRTRWQYFDHLSIVPSPTIWLTSGNCWAECCSGGSLAAAARWELDKWKPSAWESCSSPAQAWPHCCLPPRTQDTCLVELSTGLFREILQYTGVRLGYLSSKIMTMTNQQLWSLHLCPNFTSSCI